MDATVGAHMAFRVEIAQRSPQPGATGLARQLFHGDAYVTHLGGGAARQVDLDRRRELASAEHGTRLLRDEQHFVHVVMQNGSELLQVVVRERDADFLGQRVAERVGMPEPLALHHFDGSLRWHGLAALRHD